MIYREDSAMLLRRRVLRDLLAWWVASERLEMELAEKLSYLSRVKLFKHICVLRIETFVYNFVKTTFTIHVLLKYLEMRILKLKPLLAPLVTNPALTSLHPVLPTVDIIALEMPSEYALSSRVNYLLLVQHIACHFPNTQVEQGHLASVAYRPSFVNVAQHSLFQSFNL